MHVTFWYFGNFVNQNEKRKFVMNRAIMHENLDMYLDIAEQCV